MFIFRKSRIEELLRYRGAEKDNTEEERLELEKGDTLAIALAAVRVFLPILVLFVGGIYLVTWLFVR